MRPKATGLPMRSLPEGRDGALLSVFEPFDLPATLEPGFIEFLSPFPSEQRGCAPEARVLSTDTLALERAK